MDRIPGRVVDTKDSSPDQEVDSRLALAAKVNLLSNLLSQHGITAPYEVVAPSSTFCPAQLGWTYILTRPGRATGLMDLPNELLLKICRCVIYDVEKPKTRRLRALEVCAGHAYWMHEGVLLVAYVSYRLSANVRLRSIALDELFANMTFRVAFGHEKRSKVSMSRRCVALPYWLKEGQSWPMQNYLSRLMDQVTQLEVKIEPFESTRGLGENQAHLCLKGVTAELSWIPTILPRIKKIHCSIGRKSKTMFNHVLKGFLEDTIAAMRQWNTIERRSIAHETATVQNRFLECTALRPGTVIEWMDSREEDAALVI